MNQLKNEKTIQHTITFVNGIEIKYDAYNSSGCARSTYMLKLNEYKKIKGYE